MSCEHCERGRLTMNLYPQLDFDPEAERKFYMYTVLKGIFDSPDGPMWSEVHVPGRAIDDLLENAEVASYTRARFCPVCGGDI